MVSRGHGQTWAVLLVVCSVGCAAEQGRGGLQVAGSGGAAGQIIAGGSGNSAGIGGAGGLRGPDAAMPLCTSCGGCEEQQPVLRWMHVSGSIEYPDPPPVDGDHDPCWARWGVHTDVVPARKWVHNLEHGGVVLLYHCPDGCEADRAVLTALARANPRTLLTAYPDLPKRFAVVAWGHRLLSDCVDTAVFKAFYDAHFDHGRESVASDPPASCPQ